MAEKTVIQEHVHRYFKAVYGEDYVYRAPETFPNKLEQWMLGIARGDEAGLQYAEERIVEIENYFKEAEK